MKTLILMLCFLFAFSSLGGSPEKLKCEQQFSPSNEGVIPIKKIYQQRRHTSFSSRNDVENLIIMASLTLREGDVLQAAYLMEKAALFGSPKAQFKLSLILKDHAMLTPEHQNKWLLESARNNYPPAQFELGKRYLHGDQANQSSALAFKWFFRAAIRGHAQAAIYLASMYKRGLGINRHPHKAKHWEKLAKYYNAKENLSRPIPIKKLAKKAKP